MTIFKMLEAFENEDDVQQVFHNMKLTEELEAELSKYIYEPSHSLQETVFTNSLNISLLFQMIDWKLISDRLFPILNFI